MRWALIAILCSGVASAAGGGLIDDFESANRLLGDVPPGPWNNLDSYANVTLTRFAAAAHRGSAGLRLDDQSSVMGGGDMTALYGPVGVIPDVAQLRFWVRLTSSNGQGAASLGQLLSNLPDGRTFCEVGVDFTTGQLLLNGADSQGVYLTVPASTGLDGGTMTLVECSVRGLGTLAGERLLHVNGVRVAQQAAIDLRDAGVSDVALGQPFSSDRRFVGIVDYDDVRVADHLQASRIWVDAGVTAFVQGQCTPVDVGFMDSEGGVQSMPYDMRLSSTVQQAQMFSDSSCTIPLGSFMLPVGQAQLRFYIRAGVNSPVSFDVSHIDLLSAIYVRPSTPFVDGGVVDAGVADAGVADAGVDAGTDDAGLSDAGVDDAGVGDAGPGDPASPVTYVVGCGCASVSPLWLLGAMSLLLRARRGYGFSSIRSVPVLPATISTV